MVGAVVEDGAVSWKEDHQAGLLLNESDHFSKNGTDSNDTQEVEHVKISYAMSVTLAVGIMQVLLGVVRVGFVASFMSDALISGFTTGAAVHVLSSQVHAILGIPVGQFTDTFKLVYLYRDVFMRLHEVNWVTVATSACAILLLVLVREGINNNRTLFPRLPLPLPVELIVIVGATLLSNYFHLATNHDVQITGVVPIGLPRLDLSTLQYTHQVLQQAFAICLTAFALTFAQARIMADKHAYHLDANQELVALGMANVIGPLFSAFCSSASLSRSMVQEEVGGKTQVTGLVSSFLVLIVLLFIGPLFSPLPISVLAALIVVSLKRLLLQCSQLLRLWKVSKVEFTVWLVVFFSTVLLDVDVGLLVGIVFNLIPVLLRTQRPYVCLMGQIEGTEIYADLKGHVKVSEVAGVKIFRFESALYFGNAQQFRNSLEAETRLVAKDLQRLKTAKDEAGPPVQSQTQEDLLLARRYRDYHTLEETSLPPPVPDVEVKAIVIDGSTLQSLDTLTLKMLIQIVQDYKAVGIIVYLAECKPTVSAMLETSGFYDEVGRGHVCDTIHQAVVCALHFSSRSPMDLSGSDHGAANSIDYPDTSLTETN